MEREIMVDNREQIQRTIDSVMRVEYEIGKAIIGQKDILRMVILGILTDGNILLEGAPGLGKTQLVKTLARVLDISFSRIQFTPDLMPADVTGTNLIVSEDGRNVFTFESGPIFANIVLADEINRATPKTQSALLEAMQEKTVTVGKKTYILPQPFMVLATQNPIEHEGTYPLPEAQLDRFLFKLNIDFPATEELREILEVTVGDRAMKVDRVIGGQDILHMRRVVKELPMAGAVMEHILRIVSATHPENELAPAITKKYILNGASPRAAQAIYTTSKARAMLEGRYHVSFEDVEYVACAALRHRLICNFDAIADGVKPDAIIREIIQAMKAV